MKDIITELDYWMMNAGRRSNDAVEVVSHFCSALVEAGVPLWRVNIGQRFANPLLIAWGVVWTPELTETYDVTHERLLTDDYVGSSFEYIFRNQRPLHKSLLDLDPDSDHTSYLKFAEAGGTDYYATLLDYGDGSQHGCTFATREPAGFEPDHLAMIEASKAGLSCALEPVTMRKSTRSLLRTYLGNGPSEAVWNGTIKRGEHQSIEAVVMFTDLRDFTALSDTEDESVVLDALDDYFELVVHAVEENSGDVLKFMGDGVLSVFPIPHSGDRDPVCMQAVTAARSVLRGLSSLNASRAELGKVSLDIGIGINAGRVSFGNIGSQGRLDFTVLGSAVNIASRIESLTKIVGNRVLVTKAVADSAPEQFIDCGLHKVRGLGERISLFGLN